MASLFPRWPGLRLLAGSTMFNLASGCYTITLGQALFEKSGSVSAFTGIVVIEYMVPMILGALAGSMADRINPAVVCAVASIVPALSLIAYLVAPAGLLVVAGVAIGLDRQPCPPVLSSWNLRGRSAIPGSGRPPAIQHAVDRIRSGRSDRRWCGCRRIPLGRGTEVGLSRRRHRLRLAAYALASARSTMSTTHDEDGATDDTGWGSVLREAIEQYAVGPVVAASRRRLPDDRRVQCRTGTTCPPALRE